MDIHPILVHFPIALLTLYVIFECVKFKDKAFEKVKLVFLSIGTFFAWLSLQTGDFAAEKKRGADMLVKKTLHLHENFAGLTTGLFLFILILYVIDYIESRDGKIKNYLHNSKVGFIWNIILKVQKVLFKRWLIILVALAGLVAVFLTGTFGAIMVYGKGIDMITGFVYRVFVQ